MFQLQNYRILKKDCFSFWHRDNINKDTQNQQIRQLAIAIWSYVTVLKSNILCDLNEVAWQLLERESCSSELAETKYLRTLRIYIRMCMLVTQANLRREINFPGWWSTGWGDTSSPPNYFQFSASSKIKPEAPPWRHSRDTRSRGCLLWTWPERVFAL